MLSLIVFVFVLGNSDLCSNREHLKMIEGHFIATVHLARSAPPSARTALEREKSCCQAGAERAAVVQKLARTALVRELK